MKTGNLSRRLRATASSLARRPAVALVVRVVRELGEDGAGDIAGSIAYYAILSIFPLLLGVIAVLGLFLPSATVQAQIFQFIGQYFPGSTQFVERNITGIIEVRDTLGLVSIIGLFWTGSAIFGAIGRAVNRAWNIRTYRPYYLRKLRDISVAIGTSLLFFLSMGATAFSSLVPVIALPVLDSLAIVAGRLLGFTLVFVMLLLLYKFMPNIKTAWRYVWPGAMLAAVLFELARTAFTIYLGSFASYDTVYGPVAAVIIFLVWVYFSAFILIIGAEFASEYGRMRRGLERGALTAEIP